MKNNIRIVLVIVCVLAIAIGAWIGGEDGRKVKKLTSLKDIAPEKLEALESISTEASDYSTVKYNLGVMYYNEAKYEEARKAFEEVLNSNRADELTTRKILYNLGNTYYRLSEKSEETEASLDLLAKSLVFFRSVIEREQNSEKYSDRISNRDKDASFNYVLVRSKLKILQDKLRKQKQDQQSQQQLYELLVELKEREELIASQLEQMEIDPSSKESTSKRVEILKARQENLERMRVIKEKIQRMLAAQKNAQQPGNSSLPGKSI